MWDRTNLFYIVNIMGADAMATQGARASATSILIMLNGNNSILARGESSKESMMPNNFG